METACYRVRSDKERMKSPPARLPFLASGPVFRGSDGSEKHHVISASLRRRFGLANECVQVETPLFDP